MQEKQILNRISKAEQRIVDLYRKLLSGGVGGLQTLANVLVTGQRTGGNNIIVDDTDAVELNNTSLLKKGSYDFGGNGGISRICSNQYEDMWQNGFRHVFDQSGFIRTSSNCFNVVPDETFDETLRFAVGSLWTLDDGTTYKCLDNTTGAAVWVLYSSPVSSYKVFTALLTQNGASNPQDIDSGNLTVGVTYFINNNVNGDFTNVGAPNNDNGTYFVATGTTPADWGINLSGDTLTFDTATPVVKVLENTIGDIWFEYNGVGLYKAKSNGSFISNKTAVFITSQGIGAGFGVVSSVFLTGPTEMILTTQTASSGPVDGNLNNSTFEIRVYN
jgi:hypothetical protein